LRNKLLSGLLISAILLSLVTPITSFIALADGDWWNNAWDYRVKITVSSEVNVDNYVLEFILYQGTGTSSGDEIYLQNNAEADYDDIRWIDSDNTTELDHFYDRNHYNLFSSAYTYSYVECNLTIGNNTLWLYYGNSGASTTSSGSDTFLFFDDFAESPTTSGLWTTDVGADASIAVTNSMLQMYALAAADGQVKMLASYEDSQAKQFWSSIYSYTSPNAEGGGQQNGYGFSDSVSFDGTDLLFSDGVYEHDTNTDPRQWDFRETANDGSKLTSDVTTEDWMAHNWKLFNVKYNSSYARLDFNNTLESELNLNESKTGMLTPSYACFSWTDTGENMLINSTFIGVGKYSSPEPYAVTASAPMVVDRAYGCPTGWVFVGRTQYEFWINVTSSTYGDQISAGLGFYDDAGRFYSFYYDDDLGRVVLTSPEDGISVGINFIEEDDNSRNFSFNVMFNPTIADSQDVDLYYRTNEPANGDTGWTLGASDQFHIYNIGGLVEYVTTGDGAHTTGGDSLEGEVTNGTLESSFSANITWDKLQHVHLQFSIDTDSLELNDRLQIPDIRTHTFEVEYGFYTYLDDEWIKQFYMVMFVTGGEVGLNYDPGGNSDKSWVNYNVTWYDYDDSVIKTDIITSYHWGYDKDYFPSNFTVQKFWFDMWFNSMNGSTVMGGRLNAYWHGMSEEGTWWFGYGDFRPVISNVTQSMAFKDLVDENGTIISAKEVGLCKFYTKLTKLTHDDDTIKLRDYDVFTHKVALDNMEGIDTPSSEFQPTQDPQMPMGGFLGGLSAAFQRLADQISEAITLGALSAWSTFAQFVDVLFGYFGFTDFTDTTLSIISNFWTQITTYFSEGYLVTFITDIFTGVSNGFGFVTSWASRFFSTIGQIFSIAQGIIDGTHSVTTGLGNLWDLFEFSTWGFDFLPIAGIISWFISLDNRRKAGKSWTKEFVSDLVLVSQLMSFFIDITFRVITFTMDLIFKLLEAIPFL